MAGLEAPTLTQKPPDMVSLKPNQHHLWGERGRKPVPLPLPRFIFVFQDATT